MGRLRATCIGLALVGSSMLAGTGLALAQGADTTPHPAHVHQGTCAQLNPNPQYPLNPVTEPKSATKGDKTPTPPPAQGVLTATPVLFSDTEIDVKLSDLLASPHAINVHKSDAEVQTYIACGDIGGQVINGRLLVALHPQAHSGDSGVAVLLKKDDKTEVTIYLVPPSTAPTAPAATPTS